MQNSWYRGYRWIIFEDDSKQLVDLVNHRQKDIAIDNIINDIHHWVKRFAGVQILHTGRNKLAHIGR